MGVAGATAIQKCWNEEGEPSEEIGDMMIRSGP
jgi:hypothetical protein